MTVKEYNGDVSSLEITYYIPVLKKISAADKIIKEQVLENKNFITVFNSVIKEMMMYCSGILLFTNLTIESIEDYDLLVEQNYLDNIVAAIGQDFNRYTEIYENRFQDLTREANSIGGMLEKATEGLGTLLSQVDIETLKKIIGE